MSEIRNEGFSISGIDKLLGIMACLSLILIVTPKDWLGRSIEIVPDQWPATILDDVYSGGNSRSSWVNEPERHWRCELGQQFRNPYCSMQMLVVDGTQGLDLSNFHTMHIRLHYTGPDSHIRVYLRNRHPAYYKEGDHASTKYNVVELPVEGLDEGVEINLLDFSVADWWLVDKGIPLKHSHPEFSDIMFFEIQTSSRSSPGGIHEFRFEHLEFEGSLVSDEGLFKWMAIGWSVLIFGILLYRVVLLNLEVKRNRERHQELLSINGVLNLQNKQFEELAKSDQLTGLLNRIGIRDGLYDGLKDWKASRRAFSLVMIDIDHFKKVNDSYGHDVGDAILVAVSQRFKTSVRNSDLLARWGGEEFILVCPGTDLAQAQAVAESLRKKLADEEVHAGIHVTASFGVATLTDGNLDELFKRADEALYEAKHQGRNKVICKI